MSEVTGSPRQSRASGTVPRKSIPRVTPAPALEIPRVRYLPPPARQAPPFRASGTAKLDSARDILFRFGLLHTRAPKPASTLARPCLHQNIDMARAGPWICFKRRSWCLMDCSALEVTAKQQLLAFICCVKEGLQPQCNGDNIPRTSCGGNFCRNALRRKFPPHSRKSAANKEKCRNQNKNAATLFAFREFPPHSRRFPPHSRRFPPQIEG